MLPGKGDASRQSPARSSGSLTKDFGFRAEINDLESQRIPAARLRILRSFAIRVLNGRDPVGKRFLGTRTLAHRLEIPHLRQVRQSARSREEADRIDLYADAAAVLVQVQRRI